MADLYMSQLQLFGESLNSPCQQEKLEDCGWSSMEMASKVDLISGPRMLCMN